MYGLGCALIGIVFCSDAFLFKQSHTTSSNSLLSTRFSKSSIYYNDYAVPLSNTKLQIQVSSSDFSNSGISTKVQSFLELIRTSLHSKQFVSISLQPNTNHANYESQADLLLENSKFKLDIHNLKSLNGRLILIKNDIKCQFIYRYKTNDQVKNYDIKKELLEVLIELFSYQYLFKKSILVTNHETVELIFSNAKGNEKIKTNVVKKKMSSFTDTFTNNSSSVGNNENEKNRDDNDDDDIVDYYYKTTNNITPNSESFPFLLSNHHNRQKQTPIPSTAPFLRALKVTLDDTSGTPRSGMADKLKQIQKFVEIIDGLITTAIEDTATTTSVNYNNISKNKQSNDRYEPNGINTDNNIIIDHTINNSSSTNISSRSSSSSSSSNMNRTMASTGRVINKIRIVDMGCGMGYLTFAVHSHFANQRYNNPLQQRQKQQNTLINPLIIETTGVEIRGKLVQSTNAIASGLGKEFDGLKFIKGDIASFQLDHVFRESVYNPAIATNIDDDDDDDDDIVTNNRVIDAYDNKSTEIDDDDDDDNDNDDDDDNAHRRHIDTKSYKSSSSSSSSSSAELLVFIALHACDTATDEAIWRGIQSSADVIVLSPCCQKQVRQQIDDTFKKMKRQQQHKGNNSMDLLSIDNSDIDHNDDDDDDDDGNDSTMIDKNSNSSIMNTDTDISQKLLQSQINQHKQQQQQDWALLSLLESGIHRERLSEMLTDKIRALLLQLAGYQTQVFEFVDSEHTSKNTMIAAVKDHHHHHSHQYAYDKHEEKKRKELILKLNSLIDMFGITRHTLIDLFLKDNDDKNNDSDSDSDKDGKDNDINNDGKDISSNIDNMNKTGYNKNSNHDATLRTTTTTTTAVTNPLLHITDIPSYIPVVGASATKTDRKADNRNNSKSTGISSDMVSNHVKKSTRLRKLKKE